MKKIIGNAKAQCEFTVKFELTLDEAQALCAIAGYGTDAFLKVFYPQLGKAYLEPHEKGMKNLFNRIMEELPLEISKLEKAKEAIKYALQDFK